MSIWTGTDLSLREGGVSYPLPMKILQDPPLSYSRAELQERIFYCKMMSSLYLTLFNTPDPAAIRDYWGGDEAGARAYYQERAIYFSHRLMVSEVALHNLKIDTHGKI